MRRGHMSRDLFAIRDIFVNIEFIKYYEILGK